jgi:ADP-heptose:LPS heptosyltransferase
MKIIDHIRRNLSPKSVVIRTVSMLGAPFLATVAGSRGQRNIALARVRSILIIRLDEIGDLVLTTPFLRELRRNAPKAWITLIVNPVTWNLVEFCPYVNEVLLFDCRSDSRLAHLWHLGRALAFAKKHLWRRFDLAMLPRWGADYHEATLLAYFSGAAGRLAYSEHLHEGKARVNRGYDRFLTQTLDGKGLKHQVEWNLDFLLPLGGKINDSRLELWLTDDDREFAKKTLKAHGVRDGEILIAIVPGAGVLKRIWPLERWVELARRLNQEFAPRLVVVGSKREKDLGACIEKTLGSTVINLAGRATLRETSAILERCSLTVSNDSGPMHLGTAVGTAAVVLSCHPRGGDANHENSPNHFHPWGVPYVLLQPEAATPPCSGSCNSLVPHCILGIEVESVQQAVRDLLPSTCVGSPERRETANAD